MAKDVLAAVDHIMTTGTNKDTDSAIVKANATIASYTGNGGADPNLRLIRTAAEDYHALTRALQAGKLYKISDDTTNGCKTEYEKAIASEVAARANPDVAPILSVIANFVKNVDEEYKRFYDEAFNGTYEEEKAKLMAVAKSYPTAAAAGFIQDLERKISVKGTYMQQFGVSIDNVKAGTIRDGRILAAARSYLIPSTITPNIAALIGTGLKPMTLVARQVM